MKKAIKGTAVHFTFEGGLEPIVFESTKASDAMRDYAEMHGWQARLGDMAAIPRTQKDGTVITVTEAMRRDAILAGVAHYEAGDGVAWEMKAGMRPSPQNPAILRIAEARGCTYDEAMAFLATVELEKIAAM